MKKTPALLLLIAFFTGMIWTSSAKALVFEGNPDDNENHFAWSLMAQLQTPDDPDCVSVATAAVTGNVPDYMDVANIAQLACTSMASMKTSMQSEMTTEHGGQRAETNLFDAPNWHAVENLYFKHYTNGVADGKIAFSKPIDFMSYDFMKFMSNFGQNMEASEGYISLDASTVGGFANYGATLTMYDIPEFENPAILVDGEEDTGSVVSNLTYDRANNTLVFSAAHFTTFRAVEESSIGQKPDIFKVKTSRYKDKQGVSRIKVTVIGRHFDKDVDVKLGDRESSHVKRHNSRKLVAKFKESSLRKNNKHIFTLRLVNPNDNSRKHTKKIDLDLIK